MVSRAHESSVALGCAILLIGCGAGNGGSPVADGGGPRSDGATDSGTHARGDATAHAETSVGHPEASVDGGNAPAQLKGAIQKGPFVLGSSVQLSAIDSTGSPTGASFSTQTTDDLGDFDVTFAYRGYVDMQASGFYYDEVSGALSTAPITLRALYDVATGGSQTAYINIVTHLAHDRAVSLMMGGKTLAASEAQAESELVSALTIGGTDFVPGGVGVSLNELGTNDDQNAYLFAVSAIMVETVIQQSGTTSLDAQVQELIDTIASDLAVGGTLPVGVISQIQAAEIALDVDLTMDLFADRLATIGSSATPANLDRAMDSDGDGYRNTLDTCPLVANPDQAIIPTGVLCSVTRHTTFLSSMPVANSTPMVADFENTGHAGALVQGMTGWSLFLGDGTGRFAPPVAVTLPASLAPLMAYDLNKDGNQDLVGTAGWVAGDGAGHFGPLVPFSSSDAGVVLTGALAVGDFNGDSLPDVAGFGAAGLVVLLATTPGVFAAPVVSPVAFGGWLFADDVNDDGKLDLVVAAGDVGALLGDGAGHFQAGPSVSFVSDPAGAAVADFDGDGAFDVAEWDGSSNVWIAFGAGTGAFGSPLQTSLPSAPVVVGDYNSDGKTDLWVGYPSSCGASVGVLLSAGRTFGPPQALRATPSDCASVGMFVSHDLNGDGIPDTVVLNEDADSNWSLQGYIVGACPDCACAGTMCHGVCIDTTTNFFNCGACGDTCALGATCTTGMCACNGMDAVCGDACVDKSANNDNCGACGTECTVTGQSCVGGNCACPGRQLVCNGACVDESVDPNNCGSCGNACTATGQTCLSGTCVCPGLAVLCNGVCVDEASDPSNCGACAQQCSSPLVSCQGGKCACPGSEVLCSGLCVDESTDSNNCGACDNQCGVPGQSCVGGACACGAGEVLCNGSCVDESTDNNNCGACSNVCGTGLYCSLGECVACGCAGNLNGSACLPDGTCGCNVTSDCFEACDTATHVCTQSCSATQPCNGTCCVFGCCAEHNGVGYVPGCAMVSTLIFCGLPGGACTECGPGGGGYSCNLSTGACIAPP